MVDRTHCALTVEDIARIADTCHARRGEDGACANVRGFCESVALEEVRKRGHGLTPGRYACAEPQKNAGEPVEDAMKQLVAQLRGQQAKGARLDTPITAHLTALGFGDGRP